MTAPNHNSEIPWHAAYPSPKSEPASVSRSEVLQWFKSSEKGALKDFILVDLRRNDHEGGTIAGSINLPAQSLYPSFPSLYALFSAAKVKRVVWYCSLFAPCILMFTLCSYRVDSSSGRGPRAAAWFMDYTKEKCDTEIESLVLEGGIKGWVMGGEEYVGLMTGYEAAAWVK